MKKEIVFIDDDTLTPEVLTKLLGLADLDLVLDPVRERARKR